MLRTMTLPVLALLSACGGAGTPVTQAPTGLDAQIAAGERLVNRLDGVAATQFTAMPTTGQATFTGVANLFIDPVIATDADDIVVLGDLTTTANFDTGVMRGRIDNLNGATGFTASGYREIPVDGVLQIGGRESVIGNDVDDNRTNRPNDFYVDYQGDITLPDGTYAVDGTLDGQFLGTRTAEGVFPIRGLSGSGEGVASRGVEGTAGFTEYSADLDIIAEAPGRP
ncbi:hypothetical protein [Loktanella sp. R86503]|uniref:hypothetical protein n=1 Tax=Loktanella sp. R86503 TaxID=3093847 RepID=UPI0036DB9DF0